MTKVIVFSPHCDDLSLSLGGSILNNYIKNIIVYDIFSISDYTILNQKGGDKKEITFLRKEEEKKAMNLLNVKTIFLDYPEPRLRQNKRVNDKIFLNRQEQIKKDKLFIELKTKIEKIIKINLGAIFFFPLGLGRHIDHLILRDIGLKMSDKFGRIFFYEDQPYAGEYKLREIEKYVSYLKIELFPLNLIFSNLDKKMSLLKNYKSQFDAEDVYLTIFHNQRRGGEVIWGNKEDVESIKRILNKYVKPGLLKDVELLFNREKREQIIADFLNLPLNEVRKEMKNATSKMTREWNCFKRKDKEIEFYKKTKGYIFELEDWHIQDKMKQAGMIAIASQAKNKKILEYGCGTADISFLAKKCGAKEVHALDLPSKTLDFAKFKLKKLLTGSNKIKFIKSSKDINKLNLKKDYYDIISAEDVFEHVKYPKKHAQKIYNALKDGGSLFFSTEYIHSDCHPMHLKSNEKFNGVSWLYVLEDIGFEIISPCQAIKR